MPLLTGPDEGEFVWHEVSSRVNSAKNDDPQLVLPVTEEEIAAEAASAKKPARKPARATSSDDSQGSLF